MQLVFCAKKFKQYAPEPTQRKLASYLDILDGWPILSGLYVKRHIADGDYDLIFQAHIEWCELSGANKKSPSRGGNLMLGRKQNNLT